MTLTQLNAFVLVARLGFGVRAAAAALGVKRSPPSRRRSPPCRQDLGDQG